MSCENGLGLFLGKRGFYSFLEKEGFGDFPNKQNGRGPAGAGRAGFSGVWLHSLCLLRYCFSANKTFPNFKTTRKIDLWTEKSAKKEGACASP